MTKVELIYHTDCPNLEPARETLGLALEELQMDRDWVEWNSDEEDAPSYAKQYGSPTILINGTDVGKAQPSGTGSCCRVYDLGAGKMAGIPTVEMIKKSLTGAQ